MKQSSAAPVVRHVARDFLDAAYSQLEFDKGALYPAQEHPDKGSSDWVEKGDWQALAAQVGAEKIFFVEENPVVVFATLDNRGEQTLRLLYQAVWCMARPPLLFLARPGELAIYDLAKAPPKGNEKTDDGARLIDRITLLSEVQTKLARYHRERIETGAVFGDERFGDNLNRADRALIRDLKIVRQELATVPAIERGARRPELSNLHALLGRCIFVRYLEDREIINRDYFEKVIDRHQRRRWQTILDTEVPGVPLESSMSAILFLRVLRDKNFTYALFEQLAEDFNGDTFPVEVTERERIHQGHLNQLLAFLCGATPVQQDLFFYAYRFDVIPIELISSIYEEFYNEQTGKDRNQGSHYTPPALADFILTHTLTSDVLATKPRVCDAACGSGIFLVESFRRMVRHAWAGRGGKPPGRPELLAILRDQIAGVDLNPEAVRVAAFSLYLAFLHYQRPRDINEQRRLPYLKWVDIAEQEQRLSSDPKADFFNILLHANAFDLVNGNLTGEVIRRFGSGTANVAVGNPPWGYPKREDDVGSKALASTLAWCGTRRPIGDNEFSQAFVHLCLALLQEGGRAGLLLSSGVFFKRHPKSIAFRRVWLTSVRLEHVVNFAHVRSVFFKSPQRTTQGVAPFVSAVFVKTKPASASRDRFAYWSAKRTMALENTQCVLLNRGDLHFLSQSECLQYEKLWKIYWWGGRPEEALVRALEINPNLNAISQSCPALKTKRGQGFKEANKKNPAGWLGHYRELPVESFTRYGPLSEDALVKVPRKVERRGVEEVYHGHRLLLRRGILGAGHLTARLEDRPMCFRNSINGIRLEGFDVWQELTVLAIYWSSLARFYYFATAGSWGFWHDELHVDNIDELPIRFPRDSRLRRRITGIVEELQSLELEPQGMALAGIGAQRRLPNLESSLDDAIFDLYELNKAERELVHNMCTIGLDLFYRPQTGNALREVQLPSKNSGTFADVRQCEDGIAGYLKVLLEQWNYHLAPQGEFAWRLLSPPSGAPLIAVVLQTRSRADAAAPFETSDETAWRRALEKLAENLARPGGSARILVDTFFRHVTEDEILIIKRNERRFWTNSAAREDAEATLLQGMIIQERLRA